MGIEPTTSETRNEHFNYYTMEAVNSIASDSSRSQRNFVRKLTKKNYFFIILSQNVPPKDLPSYEFFAVACATLFDTLFI